MDCFLYRRSRAHKEKVMPSQYELNYNLLAFLSKYNGNLLMRGPTIGRRTRDIVQVDGEQPYELKLNGGAIEANKKDKGQKWPVRYLPWIAPRGVAYMEIDPAAHIVTTAQLSGCSMFVAVNGDKIWMFHASDNSTNVLNEFMKRTGAETAMRKAGCSSFCLTLEKKRFEFYKPPRVAGIFFGQRAVKTSDGSSAWGFYLYNNFDKKVYRVPSSNAYTNATLPMAA